MLKVLLHGNQCLGKVQNVAARKRQLFHFKTSIEEVVMASSVIVVANEVCRMTRRGKILYCTGKILIRNLRKICINHTRNQNC